MAGDRLAIPGAILLGSGLLSLVVWRGSQRIAQAIDGGHLVSPRAAGVPMSVPSGVPHVLPDVPEAPKVTELDREVRMRDEAQDAVVRQREEYRRLCAKRIPAATPPEHGAFEVDVAFDPNGRETSRTFRPLGPLQAPNWLACAKEQAVAPVHATPLGRPVTVTISLTLP